MPLVHENVDAAEHIVRSIAMCEEQARHHLINGEEELRATEVMKAAAFRTALCYVLLERRCKASGNGTASQQGLHEEINELVKAQRKEFFGD